jgi:DNA phosphorothioation-dependent restriction protein DptG
MEWNRSILSDFIDHYRSNECLWKINTEVYKNKNLKNQAYTEFVDQLKSNGMKDVNVKVVKNKLQNIRRAYRKERTKVESSKRSGKGSDDIYTPSLWKVYTYDK